MSFNKLKYPLNIQLFAEPGGDGGAGSDPGAQGGTNAQQNTSIDYEKIEQIVNKRSNSFGEGVLKNYLKQQGLTGDELDQAVASYKQQKSQAEQQKIQDQENMKLENQKLKAQILNSNIDSKLTSLAATEGVSADKIPFLSKLIDRNGLADDKGNVLEDKVKEAMNNVIKAFPDFKGSSSQQGGFQQIGGAGNQQQSSTDEQLDAIFGVKKK